MLLRFVILSSLFESPSGILRVVILISNATLNAVGTLNIAFDFNPAGEYIATIDGSGTYMISDVNTDSYSFHKRVGKNYFGGNFGLPNFFFWLR